MYKRQPTPPATNTAPDLVVTEPSPTLLTSGLPINPARISSEGQTRSEIEFDREAQPEKQPQDPEEDFETLTEKGIATEKTIAQIQQDKTIAELRKRLARSEDSESNLKQRLRRTEQVEKQNAEHLKRISNMEKDLDSHKSDLAASNARIVVLRSQLLEAEKTELGANQADNKKLSAIQEQLEDAKLEKKLADDRWSAEVKRVSEEARQQKQQASFRETELTTRSR